MYQAGIFYFAKFVIIINFLVPSSSRSVIASRDDTMWMHDGLPSARERSRNILYQKPGAARFICVREQTKRCIFGIIWTAVFHDNSNANYGKTKIAS